MALGLDTRRNPGLGEKPQPAGGAATSCGGRWLSSKYSTIIIIVVWRILCISQ